MRSQIFLNLELKPRSAELNSASKIYNRPSSVAFRVVGATLLGGQPFPPTSSCSGNCSYLVSANAPSFSCSPGASALNWTALNRQFDPPPYVAADLDVKPSLNYYSGWDFEAHFSDYASWLPSSDGGSNLTCVAYNSTYHLNYTFHGSKSSVAIDQIAPQQPMSQLPTPDDGIFIPHSTIHSAWFNATTNYFAVLASLYSYLAATSPSPKA